MKITQTHYSYMKNKIDSFLNEKGLQFVVSTYEGGHFNRASAVKDLQKRFCFDLLYNVVGTAWVCDNLYSYMNDDHIYTALKRICPKVTKKY